ncbi:hypothetical protein HYH03_012192 [Edaphochlamys debaryana]|uniref:C962R-like N-terminal AEP domain-containing protein n=1 Tax=Edaphochlamys debaryana TaxID=47281 RepID=A0A835XQQ2_9CHLO|nr:hypothetical protein HYH03_012192 [Edaphochlamys debaryana]|eukprot:KAG2489362.1 hypothetical protein HYH03_012192 [Edaphochlamys debaryana]
MWSLKGSPSLQARSRATGCPTALSGARLPAHTALRRVRAHSGSPTALQDGEAPESISPDTTSVVDTPSPPSTSGSTASWPEGAASRPPPASADAPSSPSTSSPTTNRSPFGNPLPPYATYMHFTYRWPRWRHHTQRPAFLQRYPVPRGRHFNVNSFLGKKDILNGQYLVPQDRYGSFLGAYTEALQQGYQLYLTENYNQAVYKYFVELDWDWDTDLTLVMAVTPPLLELIGEVAAEFYGQPGPPNCITSIRTPYKVHVNFPQLLTTELMACLCRDRILAACRERLGRFSPSVDWERLVDFPHGSFRIMGSRKALHMDRDPAWVVDKAYHPAKLQDGKWRPGKITPPLLQAASIFPSPDRVAAFERSPQYLDLVFGDLEAYQAKMEERRRRRLEKLERGPQPPPPGQGPAIPNLPPGSSRNPLHVTITVREDETVALNVHVKAKWRNLGQQRFNAGGGGAAAAAAAQGAAAVQAAVGAAEAAAVQVEAGLQPAASAQGPAEVAGADAAEAAVEEVSQGATGATAEEEAEAGLMPSVVLGSEGAASGAVAEGVDAGAPAVAAAVGP